MRPRSLSNFPVVYMGVSINGGTPNSWIVHKPSSYWGYPHLWKPPYIQLGSLKEILVAFPRVCWLYINSILFLFFPVAVVIKKTYPSIFVHHHVCVTLFCTDAGKITPTFVSFLWDWGAEDDQSLIMRSFQGLKVLIPYPDLCVVSIVFLLYPFFNVTMIDDCFLFTYTVHPSK